MNIEWILVLVIFIAVVVLTIYLGETVASFVYMKLLFEATKRGSCDDVGLNSSELVVAMCVRVIYNQTMEVELYNVTYSITS
ncbi:MAG: hypothetical protein QW049_03300 [Pyrobaculum sp.]